MISSATQNILNQLVPKGKFTGEVDALFGQMLAELDDETPNALIGSLINTLAESSDGFNPSKVKGLVTDLLARDRHTGYFIHPSLKTILLDFAKWCAAQRGGKGKYFLIHGDFMNLSSVNDAIDRLPTNDVMAVMCGIYQKELKAVTKGCLLHHRSMGDEVAYIAMKTSAADLNQAFENAAQKVNDFVVEMGLDRLQHKKYAHKTGTGLILAKLDLKVQKDDRELKQALDSAITKIKQKKPTETIRIQGIEPNRLHNKSSERKVRRTLKKYKPHQIELDKDVIQRAPPSLESLKQTLNGHAIAWPRDDRIEYLRKHHDGTKMMMRADIFNLGGLNNVFGNDGADVVKDHIIHILYDVMAERLAQAQIFDCGGGIIDIVCNIMDTQAILDTACAIQKEIYSQILSMRIAEYAKLYDLPYEFNGQKKLLEIPHPRMDKNGTGIIMATHMVKSYRSLPEIIERLDKITNRTKMHGFAFLGYNIDKQVVAFDINKAPELKILGRDDADANRHYLPFTKALKRHIHPDDILDIFNRPIGQICEIVFGSDMQAVLGFKKAIRALQDIGVADEDIEKIKTYDQMDIRLIAADLPPLSVVSTQKRPSTTKGEREPFMTMSLAEKLEGLPQNITPYILDAQAIFRTLKLLEPHGHQDVEQSKQVFLEELIGSYNDKADKTMVQSFYDLTNILDYGFACFDKQIPKKCRDALNVFARKSLSDVITRVRVYGENSLAILLNDHALRVGEGMSRSESLKIIEAQIETLIKKIKKEDSFEEEYIEKIQAVFSSILKKIMF